MLVDDRRRRNEGRQRRHQSNRAGGQPLASYVAPVRVMAPPRARGILGPRRRHEAGDYGALAARLRQARHSGQHAFEPGEMPVGSFGQERLHVERVLDDAALRPAPGDTPVFVDRSAFLSEPDLSSAH